MHQEQHPAPAPTRRLSREAIIDTALAQIDRSGAQSLSMRSLAQELGVEAMSLYRYVEGKDDLLERVVEQLMGDMTSRLDADLTEHWQGFLQALANEVRRLAVEHPKAFPLVATRPPAAPWLRPPLRSVELVNTFLSTLLGFGFTDEQAVHTYRSFSSFLLGQLLLEASVRGVDPVDTPFDDADPSGDDDESTLADAPQVLRLRPLLSEDRSEAEFETALEAVLDRLARDLAQ
ncbi:transcriptional regulator, TetR family [Agrococcus baldri]|uniref:Transcriptional regulator, TetR family n=2 Tax=Agrococcus baldri TaxID=153730 RepID=A0AA94HKK4_9MICO|nr:transcriptional regulator, TetR family [Agrococcus baldri]